MNDINGIINNIINANVIQNIVNDKYSFAKSWTAYLL